VASLCVQSLVVVVVVVVVVVCVRACVCVYACSSTTVAVVADLHAVSSHLNTTAKMNCQKFQNTLLAPLSRTHTHTHSRCRITCKQALTLLLPGPKLDCEATRISRRERVVEGECERCWMSLGSATHQLIKSYTTLPLFLHTCRQCGGCYGQSGRSDRVQMAKGRWRSLASLFLWSSESIS
jgi:hypothetical protein